LLRVPLSRPKLYAWTAAAVAPLVVTVQACTLLVSTEGLSGPAEDSGPQTEAAPRLDGGAQDADAEGSADSGAETGCPGTGGPTPVRVDAYCIDATEVTIAQYQSFLASGANPVMPSYCAYRTSHVPKPAPGSTTVAWPPLPAEALRPVHNVDWCDAWAFCAWTGKRLCGRIGGGSNTPSQSLSPTLDQWHRACTHAGTRAYPYGSTLIAGACNGVSGVGRTVDVSSLPTCEGGYTGIFQMTGNVAEWADNCESTSGANDPCHPRGRGYEDGNDKLRCDNLGAIARSSAYSDVGIRCCTD
jgi:formylglycine-generating enzyme